MSRDESFKQKEKEKNYKYRENVKQIRAEEKRKSEESREIKHNEYKCVCGSIIQLKEKQKHETTSVIICITYPTATTILNVSSNNITYNNNISIIIILWSVILTATQDYNKKQD